MINIVLSIRASGFRPLVIVSSSLLCLILRAKLNLFGKYIFILFEENQILNNAFFIAQA